MVETLRVMRDMRREMGEMQTELFALREQPRRARQPGGMLERIMTPVTRQGPSIPPNNTNPNNMTPDSVLDMIDQALLRNSTNGDESYSSHEDSQTLRVMRDMRREMGEMQTELFALREQPRRARQPGGMLESLITRMLLGILIFTSKDLCYFIFLGHYTGMLSIRESSPLA
nr:hypothetical protein [Tanacetum cinerariifolium]